MKKEVKKFPDENMGRVLLIMTWIPKAIKEKFEKFDNIEHK